MAVRNRSLFFILIGTLMLGQISCELPTEIGAEAFRDESFDLFPVDTFSILLSTVKPDSFISSRPERLLLGHRQDEIFGTIQSFPYFQLGLDSILTEIDRRTNRFDSLTFFLPYDGYYYFDTTQEMSLGIHRLREVMDTEDGFFNRTQFVYNRTPLAEINFLPKPRRREPLEIRLPDELGRELYEMIIDEAEEVTEEDRFLDFFRGLVLIPDTTQNTPFLGLAPPQIQMRLYFTDFEDLPTTQRVSTFSAASGTLEYFNNLQANFQSSNLKDFQSDKEETLEAVKTAETAHLQGGSGLTIRVEFPSLRDLLVEYEDFIVSRAVFRFKPIADPENKQEMPLESLITTIVDEDNDLIRGNTDNARLNFDLEFGRDTYYEVDVTNFVKTQIDTERENRNALLFRAQFQDAMVDRVRIADFPELEMKLTVFLLRIN